MPGTMVISRRRHGRLPVLLVALATCLATAVAGCSPTASPGRTPLHVGYFPNITHAQAVVGVADGSFRRALGAGVDLRPHVFNAGPSAIEALFAGQLDLAYIGPNPAINGFVRSGGRALRIVAGATSGGAVLVVRSDASIRQPSDFLGRRIASPQLGNTQDVALRRWLQEQGLTLREQGGSTAVLPIANPDILTLFLKKEIDAAWVPEPWGARLEQEAGGRLFLDERDLWPGRRFVTAHVIVRTGFLEAHPDIVARWLDAHVELTRRINADASGTKRALNLEIERLTGKRLPDAVLDAAWSRLDVTWDPVRASLQRSADAAFRLGFLGDAAPRLDGIYDLRVLNQVLRAKNLPVVE
jgi:NitT/TauT family transport system substrate-binding protein